MAIKEITPQQAHDILTKDPSVVYIDVRTEREFANGHPAGAVNIPVAFPDPARGMTMNADFVKVVEANFPHEKMIIVGCQAGPRSNAAACILQAAGDDINYKIVGFFGFSQEKSARINARCSATWLHQC
jgi:rhodanese-related sulfurtransferase